MVPAAVMGIDAPRFLDRADVMAIACSSCLPVGEKPRRAARPDSRRGRAEWPRQSHAGHFAWHRGFRRVAGTTDGGIDRQGGQGDHPGGSRAAWAAGVYGNDRVFAYIRLDDGADPAQDQAMDALAQAGQPVIRIALSRHLQSRPGNVSLGDRYSRGGLRHRHQCFQPAGRRGQQNRHAQAHRRIREEWLASGRNADFTRRAASSFTLTRRMPRPSAHGCRSDKSLAGYLRAHLNRLKAGDYFALLAYIEMNEPHESDVSVHSHGRPRQQASGHLPRFRAALPALHRPGLQGRPELGVFLQITCDDAADLPVPGQKYTFGVVKAAQARGDFQVLAERKRRALRVHFATRSAGCQRFESALAKAQS